LNFYHYSEEFLGRAAVNSAILYLGLFGQVFGRLDRTHHAFDSEKRGQVSGVRADQDEREEPPGAGDQSTRDGLGRDVDALLHERRQTEPERVEDREIIAQRCFAHVLLQVPLIG